MSQISLQNHQIMRLSGPKIKTSLRVGGAVSKELQFFYNNKNSRERKKLYRYGHTFCINHLKWFGVQIIATFYWIFGLNVNEDY